LIPKSNPFLRDFFYQLTGPRLDDEPFASFVDDLVRLLARTDMAAVLADFGKRTRQEDPVVHFYETFLAAYDPKLREARGVYYTPEPVVSYITRAVDTLLKDRFGCADGLADSTRIAVPVADPGSPKPVMREMHRVLVLDFACGTATFLYTIIDLIRRRFIDQGNAGAWPPYVREHLLPRIFGFELLMAPYAVAHFKLSLQLAARDLPEPLRQQLAYFPSDGERIGVYLTNTLEEAHDLTGLPLFTQWVADETNRANAVKRQLPIMVVTGNPPYSNFGMMNRNAWISGLLDDYKQGLDEKKLNLDDDFIKFIRFGQWRIEQTGGGILAVITNNTYLDGLTHRRMRESLLGAFTDIYILDLHGNSKKKETAPDGGKDDNVFDIQQGVAIAIFVKEPGKKGPATVHHADLWGRRSGKYAWLNENDLNTTSWTELKPKGGHFFFVPKDMKTGNEYLKWWGVKDIFPVSGCGVKTERDALSIHWTPASAEAVVNDFRTLDEHRLREKYGLGDDSRDWKVAAAKADVCEHRDPALSRKILYRPFDIRHTWYSGQTRGFIGTPGYPVMRHMLAFENLGLAFMRQVALDEVYSHFFASRLMMDNRAFYSNKGIMSLAPLYVLPEEKKKKFKFPADTLMLFEPEPAYAARTPNLNPKFIAEFARQVKLDWQENGPGDLTRTFGPEDVFHYLYAVFHSPAYRERYAEFLKIDFPRLPLPADTAQFQTLCGLGRELVALHLMEAPVLASPGSGFPASGNNDVAKGFPKYLPEAQRVLINADQYFAGVPPEVWEFRVGGYQVCEKWLKDRRGLTLDFGDLTHYRKIITALTETRRLMAAVDMVATFS
ncbi:MAG: type ISP restriction/modification enzyme, partial [Lentisphaeria bacterium]